MPGRFSKATFGQWWRIIIIIKSIIKAQILEKPCALYKEHDGRRASGLIYKYKNQNKAKITHTHTLTERERERERERTRKL